MFSHQFHVPEFAVEWNNRLHRAVIAEVWDFAPMTYPRLGHLVLYGCFVVFVKTTKLVQLVNHTDWHRVFVGEDSWRDLKILVSTGAEEVQHILRASWAGVSAAEAFRQKLLHEEEHVEESAGYWAVVGTCLIAPGNLWIETTVRAHSHGYSGE